MTDNRRYGWRCTPCDVNFPLLVAYEDKCPLCGKDTWRILEESVDILDQASAIKFIAQRQFEQKLEADQQADLKAAQAIGRDPLPIRMQIRIIEDAKRTLRELPVANRFDIPAEERCPAYEAETNPRA